MSTFQNHRFGENVGRISHFYKGFCQNFIRIRVSAEKSKTISSDFMFSAEGGRHFWTAWQVFEGFFQENDEKSVNFVDFVCFFVPARQIRFLPGISKTCQDFSSKKVDMVDIVDMVKKNYGLDGGGDSQRSLLGVC